ncbi:uncharacterized protein [Littorina saxatilis]|uniref:Uncharacterized protein n=1 Tax=Littorina saxatilis TaxID=31220 RepID=A0AAN9GEU7_9CAEN
MSAREPLSTYRTNSDGTIHPETDNPALLALLREKSTAEHNSPSRTSARSSSTKRAKHAAASQPDKHGESSGDRVVKAARGKSREKVSARQRDSLEDQSGESAHPSLTETQKLTARVESPVNPVPIPAARSISQTIIREDNRRGSRSGNPSQAVTPISRIIPSETDSTSSELALLVDTTSRKSFILSEVDYGEEADDEEDTGTDDVDEEGDSDSTPVPSPDRRVDGRNSGNSAGQRGVSKQYPHPPPSPGVPTASAALPAAGVRVGTAPVAHPIVLHGPAAPSPDLTNPDHQRFVTPYAARRLKDKPVGRRSAVRLALHGEHGERATLNILKDQSWSVNQAARLRAQDAKETEASPVNESGADSTTPTPKNSYSPGPVDSLEIPTDRSSKAGQPQTGLNQTREASPEDEDDPRRSEGPPPIEGGRGVDPPPQSRADSNRCADSLEPRQTPKSERRADSLEPRQTPKSERRADSLEPQQRSKPNSRAGSVDSESSTQAGDPDTDRSNIEPLPQVGPSPTPLSAHNTPLREEQGPALTVGASSSVSNSARATPASILKKPREQDPPVSVNKVYVESPTFTPEEEDEYRFVSSRIDNHDDEDPNADHPTYRGLDEHAVNMMERGPGADSRATRKPFKQVRYEDDQDRYEDREEIANYSRPAQQQQQPPQRQYVIKTKSESAQPVSVNLPPAQPVRSLTLPSGPSYDPADEEDLERESSYQQQLKDRVSNLQRNSEDTVIPRLPLRPESEDFKDSLNFPEDVELDSERLNRHRNSIDLYEQQQLQYNMQNTQWGDPPAPPPGRGNFPPQRQAYGNNMRHGYAQPQQGFANDPQMQDYEDPQRYADVQRHGYADNQRQGYAGPQRQGYADNGRQGYVDNDRQGYVDPQRQGYGDTPRQGYANPETGYAEPQRQAYANPQRQRYANPPVTHGDPQRQGYGNPQEGYADPQRQGYADTQGDYADTQGGYAEPQRQGFANPQRQGYVDPNGQDGYYEYAEQEPQQYGPPPVRGGNPRLARQAPPPPRPQQGGYHAQETQPPPQSYQPQQYAPEPDPRFQDQRQGQYMERNSPPPQQGYVGSNAAPQDGFYMTEPRGYNEDAYQQDYNGNYDDRGGVYYAEDYDPAAEDPDRYEQRDVSQRSTGRESEEPEKPKVDYILHNKFDYGRPQKRTYKKIHNVKKEEEEKLNHIFIHPKVKGKGGKGSRNTSPSKQPTIAEDVEESVLTRGAQDLWAQRSASLAHAKNAKAGKKKSGSGTSMMSNNRRMFHSDSSLAGSGQPLRQPLQSVNPSANHMQLVPAAQQPLQMSPSHTPHYRQPLDLRPIKQELVTEDGQRISVDVNLRLISPTLGMQAETGEYVQQPMGNQRHTGMQYPVDRMPNGQQPYRTPDENYGPPERYSADDALARNAQGNRVAAGYVSDSNHDYSSPAYSTNPYTKIPPIPASSEAPRSAPVHSEGSYMMSYLRDKEKLEKKERPRYKVYGLKDYQRMQNEVRLGTRTLGPDLDNDTFKERREKALRQMEYAKAVKAKNTQELVTRKPPSFPRTNKEDDMLSKRRLAVEYAKNVPKPTVKPKANPYNSYELASQLSPIAKQSYSPHSPQQESSVEVLDLERLHERHQQDKQSAEMIQRKVQGVMS